MLAKQHLRVNHVQHAALESYKRNAQGLSGRTAHGNCCANDVSERRRCCAIACRKKKTCMLLGVFLCSCIGAVPMCLAAKGYTHVSGLFPCALLTRDLHACFGAVPMCPAAKGYTLVTGLFPCARLPRDFLKCEDESICIEFVIFQAFKQSEILPDV